MDIKIWSFRLEKSSAKAFGINWGSVENQEWLERREHWLHKEVSKRMIDTVFDCEGLITALFLHLKNSLPVGIQTKRYEMNERDGFCGSRVHKDIFESFIFRNALQTFSKISYKADGHVTVQ